MKSQFVKFQIPNSKSLRQKTLDGSAHAVWRKRNSKGTNSKSQRVTSYKIQNCASHFQNFLASETESSKYGRQYDLEERTFQFAKAVRVFIKSLPKTLCNIEDAKQLVRSSGSVGANYIEANESLGRKDFQLKIRTCRKEAKESGYWLRLIDDLTGPKQELARKDLIRESVELRRIFTAILKNYQF